MSDKTPDAPPQDDREEDDFGDDPNAHDTSDHSLGPPLGEKNDGGGSGTQSNGDSAGTASSQVLVSLSLPLRPHVDKLAASVLDGVSSVSGSEFPFGKGLAGH